MAARIRPERSKIANDPNRPLIERALAMGVSMSAVAKRFGYTNTAIFNYRKRMPQQLQAAIIAATLKPKEADLDQLRIDEAEGILGNLAHQRARLLLCQDEAMEEGGTGAVVQLSNTIHRNIELTGRYLGLFAQHHVSEHSVNIMVSEDYLRLRQVLITALRPFPEARRAVAEALHQAEGDLARKMVTAAPPEQPKKRGSGRPAAPTIDGVANTVLGPIE
jgi:transposase-like protein